MRENGFGFLVQQDNGIKQFQIQSVDSGQKFLQQVRKYIANPELFAQDTRPVLNWDRVWHITPYLFDAGCIAVMAKVPVEADRWRFFASAHYTVERAMRTLYSDYSCMAVFMDTPGRKKAEILAVIDLAIQQIDS